MRERVILGALAALLIWQSSVFAVANDLRPFGRASWEEIRNAHAGQSLVVHFWGVTCGPCRTEMPLWGKFMRERPNMHLVMIDADLVPNDPTAVETVLKQSGLSSAENWIFNDDFVERLRYEIDPHWHGEIPLTLLIAPDGATNTIEGVADLTKVGAWLDSQVNGRR